jgi:pyruvate dehydrogenase E1 component beta subunit
MLATAVGMGAYGLRPVVEIQFADYIYPATDQLISEAARIRYRSNDGYGCPIVIRAPFGGGVHGSLYHSQSVESFFAHVPGLKVVVPSTPADAAGLLLAAIEDPDPVVFMEPIRLYRSARGELPDTLSPVALGQAAVLRSGADVTLIAWGAMVPLALESADQLAAEGVECTVIDLRTLSPLDLVTVAASVEATGRLVVVHEAPRTGGLGAEIVASLVERCFYFLRSPPERVTGYDVVYPAQLLEDQYLPSVPRIVAAVRRTLED